MSGSNVVPFPSSAPTPPAVPPPPARAPQPPPAAFTPPDAFPGLPPLVSSPPADQAPASTPLPAAEQPASSGAAPAPSAPDYDALVSNYLAQQKAQAAGNLIAAQKVNPDHAAAAATLSPILKVPPSVIQNNAEHYQGLFNRAADNAVLDQHPPLQKFLSDPQNAAVGSDDVHALGMVGQFGRGYQESALAGQIGDIEFDEKMGRASSKQLNLLGALNSQMQTMVDQDQAAQTAWQQAPGPAPRILPRFRFGADAALAQQQARETVQPGMGAALAQGAGGLVEQAKEAVPFALGAGAVSSPLGLEGGPVGVAGAFVTGAARGLAIKMAAQAAARQAGQTYVQIKQMRDQYGNPISESTAQTASTIAGVVTGLAYAAGGVGGAGEVKVATSLARKIAERQELGEAVNRFLIGTAKAGALGGAINAAIYTAQALAPQAALAASSPGEDTIFNDQGLADQFAENLAEQAGKGGLLFSLMHMPVAGTSLAMDAARAVGALQTASHFDATMQASAASKTRARAPAIFQKYLGEFTGDGNVGIAGDRVAEFYQTLGTEPGSPEDPLGFVPDIAEQVERARVSGADVNIPVAELGARLAGTPALEALMPDLRFAPDGFTVRESAEFMKNHEDMFDPRKIFADEGEAKPPEDEGEAATRAAQIEQEKAEIRAHLETMMRRAGETPGESEAKVGMLHAFFTVMAKRLGVNPMELYRDVNFDYRREKEYQAGASTYIGIDQVIDAVRAGKAPPTDREINGPSLLEYLTEKPTARTLEEARSMDKRKVVGGLVDTGGNLKHMGAGDWHKEMPGRRKLINQEGRRLDDAALEVWEAGYLPGHTERPSINDLLEAIREELHGNKQYMQPDVAAFEKAQFRQHMEDVQRVLDERGMDIKTASNADVRAALQDEAQKYGGETQTFEQTVYHGTPHEFDKFSTEHIGTGEGAQSFGWGLYFAGRKGIAEHYRDKLTAIAPAARVLIDGRPALPGIEDDTARALLLNPDTLNKKINNAKQDLAHIQEIVDHYKISPPEDSADEKRLARWLVELARLPNDISIMENLRNKKITVEGGRLYHADVPEDNELLDWDKRFSQQPSGVQEKLKQIFATMPKDWEESIFPHNTVGLEDLTGEEIYNVLEKARNHDFLPMLPEEGERSMRDDEVVSKTLNQAGIPGLRYADAASRDEDEGQTHNYVIFDDSRVAIQTFEQKLNQVTGGSFTFGEGVALMRIYETANPVTFWHEAGHLFLSVMERYAKGDNAPAQLASDYQRLKEIAGLGEDEDFVARDPSDKEAMGKAAAAQEKIVKFFETYGMEGKAPSPELEGVFQRALAWFVRVYKSLTQIGAPINDELRGIFNRWLATDEAIEQARAGLKIQNPVFTDAKSAGMAVKQFARYTAEIAKAKNEAFSKTLNKVMEVERKKRTAEWNEAADAVRPEVQMQVYSKPSLRAWARFSSGRDLADPTAEREPLRLSGKAVQRILGPAYQRFPDGLIKAKGGVDPETVYMAYGYESAADMLNDLVSENNGRLEAQQALGVKKLSFNEYVDRLVEQNVDNIVRDKLGDILTDGSIEEIAQQAANNAAQRDVMNIELRALAKRAGMETPPYTGAQIEEMVRIRFRSYNIKDAINVKNYRRAAATQANKAEIAVMQGKYLDAFEAKQKQLVALAMAKHAEDWSKFYTSAVNRWRAIGKKPVHPAVQQDFVNQVFRILDTIGVPINRDAGDLARALDNKTLDSFSGQVFADGYDMYVSKNILDAVEQAPQPGRFNYNNMNADDFQATHDTIKSIMKTGRDIQSVILDNRRQELHDIFDRVEDRLMAVDDKKISTQFTRAALGSWRGWLEAAGSNLREADGALVRLEDFFKVMDDYDHQGRGPMCELFDRVVKARYGAQDMEKSVVKAYETLAKSIPKDWRGGLNELLPNDKLIDPGTSKPEQISRKLMIGIALNVGNRGPRSNLEKLCNGMGWNADDVFQFLDQHMTQADWRYVEKTWEIYKDLAPEAEAVHREVSGIGWEKINPTPIQTKWGVVEGGYYPIFRDHTALKTQRESDKIAGIFSPKDGYYRVNTPHGYTNARVDYDAPLDLSLENVERGFAQVIHDINYRKVVIDALKILDHPRMVNMVRKKFGNEYQELFLPWLKNLAHSANVDYKKIQTFDKIFRYVRTSSGVVDIGFNLHTLEKHTLSALSRSIGEVGVVPYMSATREIFTPGNYQKSIDFIKSNSGEIRHRLETFDTLGLQKIDKIINRRGFVRWLQEASMAPISRFDYMSTFPLWLGAYRKQMANGVAHEVAVLEADRAVRAAHGSTAPESLAAISRGSETNKLFTMFYNTFFSPLYQSLRRGAPSLKSGVRNVSDAEYAAAARDFARVGSISLFSIGIPAMVEGMVSYGLPQEGDNAWKWATRSILNTTAGAIPLLRDLISYGLHRGHIEYDMTPADEYFEDLANCVKDLFDASGVTNEHENEHWVKTFLETAEMALKLPLNQGIKTGEYLWDSATDQLGPQDWRDIMIGLVNGPPKPQ